MIFRAAFVLISAAFLIAGCGGGEEDDGGSSSTEQSGGTLFEQSAGSGLLKPLPDSPDTYELLLSDVPATLTAFSDRPVRQVATETVDAFVDEWDARGFADDPPNAAIILDEEKLSQNSIVAELSEPRYDADAKTLSYTAKLLDDTENPALAPAADSIDDSPPKRLGRLHLFVDDAAGSTPHVMVISFDMSGAVELDFDSGTTLGLGGAGIKFGAAAQQSFKNVRLAMAADSLTMSTDATSDGSLTLGVVTSGNSVSGTAQVPSNDTVKAAIDGGSFQQLRGGQFSLSP